MSRFYHTSIDLIKQSQSSTGAYIACNAFPSYQYCWLRDGSFIAHAMDSAREYKSSEAFFYWVGNTISKHSYKVEDLKNRIAAGLPIGKDDSLHTRFTSEGDEVTSDNTWGNFQIDGYGTWLWALNEHVKLTGDNALLQHLKEPIEITLRYLGLVWRIPNYDCWEENPDFLHTYSISAIYAGLQAAVDMRVSGRLDLKNTSVEILTEEVRSFILNSAVKNSRLVKYFSPPGMDSTNGFIGNDNVDASLLAVSLPYNLLNHDDPIFLSTIKKIEEDLHRIGGGVYRYKTDVYYGGGEWILLTAWLGWYYASVNQLDKAMALCDWIESQADENGRLPEQVCSHTLYPEHYTPWVKKWGPVANPLTWSHAMYVILVNAIKQGRL